MSIALRAPNTIYLGGGDGPGGESGCTVVNNLATLISATPGMLAEYVNDSGVLKWRPHASADAVIQTAFYLEQGEWNLGLSATYAINDIAKVGIMKPGSVVWSLCVTAITIVPGSILQSNGNGRLKLVATGIGGFRALEGIVTNSGVTNGDRCRVEVI